MKRVTIANLICSATLVCLQGCDLLSSDSADATNARFILVNTSFESQGTPSLLGWDILHADSSRFFFSDDVPRGAGSFSVGIFDSSGSPFYIRQVIYVEPGEHILRLSIWAKSHFSNAAVFIGRKSGKVMVATNGLSPLDSVWSPYSMIDTIRTEEGESIFVAMHSDPLPTQRRAYTLWDHCILEKLN